MNIITKGKIKIQEMFIRFKEMDLCEKTNALSFVCVCFFLLDCTISGGGRYLEFYGISIRILVGVLSVLFAIPTLIKNWKVHIREPINLLFVPFVIWFLICTIRGVLKGNNQIVLMSDVKGFMYLFLIPIAVNCVIGKKRICTILNVVLIGALIQALLVFGINVFCTLETGNMMKLYFPVNDIQLGTVSDISDSIYRIFMRSGPYLIVACVVSAYRQLQNQRYKVIYSFLTAIYLNALLFSYTRSLYGSFGITALVTVIITAIVYPKLVRIVIKHLLVSVLVALLIITAEEVVFEANYLNFAIARTFGTEVRVSQASKLRSKVRGFWVKMQQHDSYGSDDSDNSINSEDVEIANQEGYLQITIQSDALRRITQNELIELIEGEPIIGNGLGAFAPSRNGPDEFFYLDVMARMGIIGLLLYVLPYLYIFVVAVKKRKVVLNACICLPFWIATAFNPWMNAAIGISCYSITMAMTKEKRDSR